MSADNPDHIPQSLLELTRVKERIGLLEQYVKPLVTSRQDPSTALKIQICGGGRKSAFESFCVGKVLGPANILTCDKDEVVIDIAKSDWTRLRRSLPEGISHTEAYFKKLAIPNGLESDLDMIFAFNISLELSKKKFWKECLKVYIKMA